MLVTLIDRSGRKTGSIHVRWIGEPPPVVVWHGFPFLLASELTEGTPLFPIATTYREPARYVMVQPEAAAL